MSIGARIVAVIADKIIARNCEMKTVIPKVTSHPLAKYENAPRIKPIPNPKQALVPISCPTQVINKLLSTPWYAMALEVNIDVWSPQLPEIAQESGNKESNK
mmetsp:Transcript_19477/g.28156  ORF Transcript_19477/g.28156 Transcript_19477/m.28156 type:complete len:102 (+) Transcript_19477:105-410(+)